MAYGSLGLALDLFLAWLFYRSWMAAAVLSPLVWILPRRMRKILAERRRQDLCRQFRDGALAVASSLACGYAIENAFRCAAQEMETVYGTEGLITREFRRICHGVELNRTVEDGVRELAERSGLPEIEQFSEVFAAAKRSSGDLGSVLKETSELLAKKINLREEIRTLVAAKRLEQNIMSMMPAGILLYINLTSPGYTDALYGNVGGAVIMTLCLGIYGLAVWWGWRILDIPI